MNLEVNKFYLNDASQLIKVIAIDGTNVDIAYTASSGTNGRKWHRLLIDGEYYGNKLRKLTVIEEVGYLGVIGRLI